MKSCVLTLLASAGAMLAQFGPGPLVQAPIAPDTVIATVDGHNVTVADYKKLLGMAPAQLSQAIKQIGPQEFLRQMFLFQHLTEEGDKNKLAEQSPLKEELQAQRNWVVANAEVNHERDGFEVTEQQLQDFYEKNKARWSAVKIKVIFVAYKPPTDVKAGTDVAEAAKQAFQAAHSASDRSEAEAKTLADDIVKQLRAGGDFKALMEKYSNDQVSRDKDGDFGAPITPTSSYADDFKKPILALQKGQISDPIRQSNGFYVAVCEDRTAQSIDTLREPIAQEIRQSHLNEYLQGLNKQYAPKILSPEFFAQPDKYLSAVPAAPAAQH